MKNVFDTTVFLFFIFLTMLFPQTGTYYDLIDVSSINFVSDLKTRIRSPYTKIAYAQFDETNIANFASQNNIDGTKTVTCVYTGYPYVYSGIFTWTVLSREHTWAHSWMPSYNSESTDEYADQHHLFPTHQNNANGRRSNHPLGVVQNVTYQYLDGKLGTNSSGEIVYEPRDEHKGDAARALLYMSIRYDGLNGYDWTFNWLNNIRLPALSEGKQDLNTLIAWHKQDPPDKWEVDRSNYIQSIQQNRNPFIDHPEYINFIDLNSLTKLNPSYAIEPNNYLTNLSGNCDGSDLTISWTDAISGTQNPSGYLLIGYNKNNYFIPIDGETYSDDTNLSDGKIVVNIPYSDPDNYIFHNTDFGSSYYFTMYSYNGNGSTINYKINEIVPHTTVEVFVPVELISFNALQKDNKVFLSWSSITELNNWGFEIERKSDRMGWEKLGFVKGFGTSTEQKNYIFTDDKIESNGIYIYRLKQINNDGTFKYSSETQINVNDIVEKYFLFQNYPNPFNPVTSIKYEIPVTSNVKIDIYDILGRLITTIIDEVKMEGIYNVEFKIEKFNLASGIYYYRLQAGDFVQIKKMLIAK